MSPKVAGDCHFITGFISCKLQQPAGFVASPLPPALRTPMPETAVNEDGQALMTKNEVWATWNGLVAAPADDPSGAKDGRQL